MKTTDKSIATPQHLSTFYKNFFCGGGYLKAACNDFLSFPTVTTKLKGKN